MIFLRTKLFFLLLIFCFDGYAQHTNNRHTKQLFISSDSIQLDTLSIVPGSLSLTTADGEAVDTSIYKISFADGLIRIDRKQLKSDSIVFSYQTFPYLFSAETKHKDLFRIQADVLGRKDPFSYTLENKSEDLFKMDGLNKTGSISRGISFGNNQDVVVNSNLNLQLSGHLNNNVDILVAATDNNIPIQPDGNTQQLQEFDKVFIQFSTPTAKLIAGDFQLTRPSGYFMNFNKKSQGISFSTSQNVFPKQQNDSAKKSIYKTSISAAVSRGKFARNQIQGKESNQGPYRLVGAEREPFIIVLSGTEKIYIDGRLMSRGQENDYIIDYNTAEVTFTAKQLITKDKRIVVEFQYSDKNYGRTLMHVSNDYETNKLRLHLHVYSEQDSKNQPLQQNLSTEQKRLLSIIGDTLSLAISPSIDSIGFNRNEVLYKKVDTVISSKIKSTIYVYSTDSATANYRLTFSNVGQGNGHYQQIASGANGKVFKWVRPDTTTGVLYGNFEPVIQLITPKKKQMLSAGLDYAIGKNSVFSLESAISNTDINTFSLANNNDDVGAALKMNFNDNRPLTKKRFLNKKDTSSSEIRILTNLNYEFVQKYFSPVERFRSTEFDRDWNRTTLTAGDNQHIVGAGLALAQKELGTVGYRFDAFFEGANYSGYKHFGNFNITKNGTSLFYNGSLLNSKSTNNTNFYRHKSGITQKVKTLIIGLKDEFEENKFSSTTAGKDTLLSSSYKFWEWQTFVQNADTTKNKYGLNYKQRIDYQVKNTNAVKALHRSAFAEDYSGYFEFLQSRVLQVKLNTSYRRLKILDSTLTLQKPDNSVVTRIEYNLHVLKGFLFINSYYEIGSGLEVKKEFSFIKVPAGQGVYTYGGDYNNNGVMDLNEFEISRFPDKATFIKVYTPTNEYIKTFSNQFSQTLMLKPSAVWSDKKGFRKFLSVFANQAAYRIDRKSTETDFKKVLNPFLANTNSSSLASLNSSFRNTLFINQLNPIFGIDLNYQDVRSKVLLVNGFDLLTNTYTQAQLRWNITQQINVNVNFKDGRKNSSSQFFKIRDYSIKYYETEPKLNYQPNTSFRFTISFKYTDKKNSIFMNGDSINTKHGGESAYLGDYGIEIKYNVLEKGSLNLKTNFININYNGLESSSIGFEMLDGLKTGKNYTWGITYQRNISHNLQLNITYDGRKSPAAKTIHTGGAQVRAYF